MSLPLGNEAIALPMEPVATQRRLPDLIEIENNHKVMIVPDDQFDTLLPPVVDVPICGFMDRAGNIHYEVNAPNWAFPQGRRKWAILLKMKQFYLSVPKRLCSRSLTKDPQDIIGAGQALFDRRTKELRLTFLGLQHRHDIPEISPAFRKRAIFHFQQSFNRLGQWLGATRLITHTAIIRDHRMQALGWQRVRQSLREFFWAVKDGFPGSLSGKVRYYEINL